VNSLDDLELELRKLPGVHAAGFDELDDMLLVQLHVGPERLDQPVPVTATRIAARHSDRPVTVEVVRWRSMPGGPAPIAAIDLGAEREPVSAHEAVGEEEAESHRPRLLAVLAFPDTDELEVHLVLEGRRTIGRAAASSGLLGAVQATVDAVRGLGAQIEPTAKWARALDEADGERVLVAVALENEGGETEEPALHYGLAAGASPIDAAARSTLDALNRRLAQVL
jgi:hypothetical protein